MALCHFRLKQFAPALKHIADIIEKGIHEHPELSVGLATEGIEMRSVGNTLGLLPESLGDENKTCHDHQDERKLRGKQRPGLPRNRCDKAAQTVTPQSPARARKGAQCAGPACCR